MHENGRNDEASAEPARQPSSSTAVGEHVTGILDAAEDAAKRIREEARAEASELERLAAVEAERIKKELTEDARSLRAEAEEYARDMRLAVEAYATQHRRQADEEARTIVADAEAKYCADQSRKTVAARSSSARR